MPKMEEHHLLPNGEEVIFYPEEHTYFCRGKELPSVTKIIENFYGNKYRMVHPEILKAAADYGTKVHKELDTLINMRMECDSIPLISDFTEVNNYFNFIEPIYNIVPVMTERVVLIYNDKGDPIAAGRFDLLCKVKDQLTLADFKTTSTINRQSVSAQLNLYLKGMYQCGYIDKDKNVDLGVIHLSGNTSKYVPIIKFGQTFFDNILAEYNK